jgi:26S proteasome regulatory subunit N10
MKKNNTSIDIIAFGDLTDENLDKLRAFNDAVKSNDGSHLEIIPPGPNLLSDSIVASPILAGEGGAATANGGGAGGEGGAGGDFEFGVDPNMDPELALVLRMSMEEERERQEREKKAREEAEGKTNLESVPEAAEGESSENQPLLDKSGEASGSKDADAKKDDKKDDDRMDTA